MSSWQLGVDLVTTFLLASYLLFQYGNWYKHHIVVTLSVLVAWYFSFVFVFVLPIDISGTAYRQCLTLHNITSNDSVVVPSQVPAALLGSSTTTTTPQPLHHQELNNNSSSSSSNNSSSSINNNIASNIIINTNNNTVNRSNSTVTPLNPSLASPCTTPSSYVPASVMQNLWRVVYWTSQLLTWLILPMMQSYVQAGEFNIKGKLRSALLDNAIYYGSYLFICGILLAYIAVKPDLELDWYKLKAIASSASNTWGLFLLVFMLGYGLVSVPQALYHWSCERRSLSNAYFRVAKLSGERSNAEEAVDDVIETLQLCVKASASLPPNLANNLQTIVSALPMEFREKMARRRVNETINEVNEKLLIKLHRNVKRALQAYQRTETQYDLAVRHAIYLEDIDRNMKSGTRIFKHSFDGNNISPIWKHLPRSFEWFARCIAHSWALKAASGCACILSFMIIWSEVTFFNKSPVLSFFALLLNSTRSAYSWMEMICTITIAYMATCAFYTIFKIRVFNFYYLASRHMTDEYSLIFAGMLLCRLTPPLCLNTLSLFHLDSHVIQTRILETSYTQVMGHMDVITLISDGFNVYFPIGILLIAILTWFRVGARVLSKVGFTQFLPDDEIVGELVSEGLQLVVREKRRKQRNLDSRKNSSLARRTGGGGGGGAASSSAVDSANVAVENLRNLASYSTSLGSSGGGRSAGSSGGATLPPQSSFYDDPLDPDEETYYSRVLIEDSSATGPLPSSNRVRVYGTSPPGGGVGGGTGHHGSSRSSYYYQQSSGGGDNPPRGLFDDV